MKKTILIVFLSLIGVSAFAQDETDSAKTEKAEAKKSSFYKTPYRWRNSGSFNKKEMLFSLSYGFPNYLWGDDYYDSYYYHNASSIGPLMFRFEMAVHDEIGVIVFGQVATRKWDYDSYSQTALGLSFGALGVYHFNKFIPVAKLDVYAGVGFEINHDQLSDNYDNYTDSRTEVAPVGMVGARYYFSKNWSAFVEAGSTGYSYANSASPCLPIEKAAILKQPRAQSQEQGAEVCKPILLTI